MGSPGRIVSGARGFALRLPSGVRVGRAGKYTPWISGPDPAGTFRRGKGLSARADAVGPESRSAEAPGGLPDEPLSHLRPVPGRRKRRAGATGAGDSGDHAPRSDRSPGSCAPVVARVRSRDDRAGPPVAPRQA